MLWMERSACCTPRQSSNLAGRQYGASVPAEHSLLQTGLCMEALDAHLFQDAGAPPWGLCWTSTCQARLVALPVGLGCSPLLLVSQRLQECTPPHCRHTTAVRRQYRLYCPFCPVSLHRQISSMFKASQEVADCVALGSKAIHRAHVELCLHTGSSLGLHITQ